MASVDLERHIQTLLRQSGLYGKPNVLNEDDQARALDAARSLISSGITNDDQVTRYISARNNTDPASGNWTSSGSLTNDALAYVKGGMEGWATGLYKQAFGGREPTGPELQDLISHLGSGNRTDAAKAFLQNPLVSQNIVDADTKARADARTAQMNKDVTTESAFLQDPYMGTIDPTTGKRTGGIVGSQTDLLNQVLSQREDESLRKLKDNLAAMGITESGSLSAGSADIGKSLQQELAKGQTQFEGTAQQNILNEAMDFAKGNANWTDEQRKSGLADIAEQIAQEYNDKQAQEYAATVAKSQSSPWSTILNAGATIGSILFPPAAPWLMTGAAAGNVAGALTQPGTSSGSAMTGLKNQNSAFEDYMNQRGYPVNPTYK